VSGPKNLFNTSTSKGLCFEGPITSDFEHIAPFTIENIKLPLVVQQYIQVYIIEIEEILRTKNTHPIFLPKIKVAVFSEWKEHRVVDVPSTK